MRILLINQFYPPDVAPTGKYLQDLAQVLTQRSHQVKVICSRRSYEGGKIFAAHENLDGVEILRLPATGFGRRGYAGKIADYTTFYFLLLWALLREKRRPDLILCLTTPPYAGLLGKLAAKWHGGRHAHWIMDLYPDVMFAHGFSRRGLGLKLLKFLTRLQLRGTNAIFALGPEMAKRVSSYCDEDNDQQSKTVHPVPLWSDSEVKEWPEAELNPLRQKRGWKVDETVFLYSGNMGLGHRFGEFLEAAKRLGAAGPRWVFAGGGKRRAEIEAFAKANPESRISFLDYVPHADLRAHLSSGDVHLASLDANWQGLMVPSKLQGSFAVGRPVLYVGGNQCETAQWIQKSGGGWLVAENDVDGLLKAIHQSLDPVERRKRGRLALNFAREQFQKTMNCRRMAELLETSC